MIRKNLVTFVLIVAVLLLLTSSSRAQMFRVGFVNLKEVFLKYQKTQDEEKAINQTYQQKLKEFKKQEKQAEELRQEIMLYRPGSPVRKDKEKEYARKLFDIRFFTEWEKQQFSNRMKQSTESIYREIIREIEKYAKARHYSMILKIDDMDFFDTRSANEMKLKINTRDVLFWDKRADITKDIIRALNRSYRNRRQRTSYTPKRRPYSSSGRSGRSGH